MKVKVTHTHNLCSAFNPSKCTHPVVNTHTHREHAPGAVDSHIAAAPGEQLGVRCLAQGHLSHGIEGGESTVHSLPPPTIPARPKTRTSSLRVTSPTLYPLGHDCPQSVFKQPFDHEIQRVFGSALSCNWLQHIC